MLYYQTKKGRNESILTSPDFFLAYYFLNKQNSDVHSMFPWHKTPGNLEIIQACREMSMGSMQAPPFSYM